MKTPCRRSDRKPNAGFVGEAGHGDRLDARVNNGIARGACFLLNAGPEHAGDFYLPVISFLHADGRGPVEALASDARMFTIPPLFGRLDARGSARVDLPLGTVPPSFEMDQIWLIIDAATGQIAARTLVVEYDS